MRTFSLSVFRDTHGQGEPHNRKKTPERKAFGLNVRMRRFEVEMTQEELAEKADLHPTYLGLIERDERNIALKNIIHLAKALKCSQKDLMPE